MNSPGTQISPFQPNWTGNRKGLPGPLKGDVILEFLAARFNFTYYLEMQQTIEMHQNNFKLFKKIPKGQNLKGFCLC